MHHLALVHLFSITYLFLANFANVTISYHHGDGYNNPNSLTLNWLNEQCKV